MTSPGRVASLLVAGLAVSASEPLDQVKNALSGLAGDMSGLSDLGGLGGLLLGSPLSGDVGSIVDGIPLEDVAKDPIGILTKLLGGDASEATRIDLANLISQLTPDDLASAEAFEQFLRPFLPTDVNGVAFDLVADEIYEALEKQLGENGALEVVGLTKGLEALGINPIQILDSLKKLQNGDEGINVEEVLKVFGLDPEGITLDNLNITELGEKADEFFDDDAKQVYDTISWDTIRGDFDYDSIYKDGFLDLDALIAGLEALRLDELDPSDLQTLVSGFDFLGFLEDTELGKLPQVSLLLQYGLPTFQWAWLYAVGSQLTLAGALLEALPDTIDPLKQYLVDFGLIDCFDTSNIVDQATVATLLEKLPNPILGAECPGNSGTGPDGDGTCSSTIRDIDRFLGTSSVQFFDVACIPSACYAELDFPCLVSGLPTSADMVGMDIRKVFANYATCIAGRAGSVGSARNGNALRLIIQGFMDSVLGQKYIAAKAIPGMALQDISVVWQSYTDYCTVDAGNGVIYQADNDGLRRTLETYFDGAISDTTALAFNTATAANPVLYFVFVAAALFAVL